MLKTGLTGCIGCGCLSLDRCRYANPDDYAGGMGNGPQFWKMGGGLKLRRGAKEP